MHEFLYWDRLDYLFHVMYFGRFPDQMRISIENKRIIEMKMIMRSWFDTICYVNLEQDSSQSVLCGLILIPNVSEEEKKIQEEREDNVSG